MAAPRAILAGNAGPFTLDGTRSWLVGHRDVALIDPGPEVESHLRALSSACASAERVRILVTHGHPDHDGGAARLAARLDASLFGPTRGGRPLAEGDRVETDSGELTVIETPGHTREHLSFFHEGSGALYCGDLVLGRGDTTWVAEYPGCVADYLDSLERVRRLDPEVIHPAHGPSLTDPIQTLDRFRRHRLQRIRQVGAALEAGHPAEPTALLRPIYGDLDSGLHRAAEASIRAILWHLGAIEPDEGEGIGEPAG